MVTTDFTTTLLDNLASYVPYVVMRGIAVDPTPISAPAEEHFPAAVLFADISGFTRLTERLVQSGPEGVEQLSNLLNSYFGRLIDIVLDHGGDIVEFTGDGIIALWTTPPEADLSTACVRASACGLAVQEGMAAFDLADGLRLALRVTIGAGDVLIACVGGILGRWELLVAGDPLVQVGAAEYLAAPGDVVLSPAAWAHVQDAARGQLLPEGSTRLQAVQQQVPAPYRPDLELTPEMIPAMGSFLPGAILDRLEAGLSDWMAELRSVTVLFVDILDLDYSAPDIVAQLHEVMRALQTGLYQYEGSVNQFIVDDKGTIFVAAMGLPPLTHEDDAVRGVQAALAMYGQVRALHKRCVIGVSTGAAFCGARGSIRRRDYAMIGDVMNLAARLMQMAHELDHGSAAPIICDLATYEAARYRLAFEALPPVSVKGKAELVPIYRPLGPARAVVRRYTELIGRSTERAALVHHLEILQRGEHAGVVVLEGETGMGKSRLINDMLQQTQMSGISSLMGLGDAIERNNAYFAWRPVFTQIFDLDSVPGDDQLARRIRVLNRLWIYPELARLAPLINAVLPLDIPETDLTAQMSGQVRADNTRTLLLGVLESVVAQNPTVLVLDEAHWLDSASWALALAVAQRVRPLLLIVATRPLIDPLPLEYNQLVRRPDTQHLVLDRLTPEETLRLVCQRLGIDSLPEQAARIVLEKSEGNPFFSEELAYAMRDAGLIVIEDGTCRIAPEAGDLEEISFPASVQGVVVSRIDRLIPAQQLTLKVASVIGQIFMLRTLNAVYPIEADRPRLTDHLKMLEHLNIATLEALEPDLTYMFKNIIIQEVVYNLLLFSQRRELHRAVAEWYEATYADDPAAYYPVLAHHWYKAECYPQAIDYFEKAGERALQAYTNHEAATFFEHILALLRRQPAAAGEPAEPPTDEDPEPFVVNPPALRRARWERQLGEAYLGLGKLNQSRQHLEQAVALLKRPVPASRRTFTTRTLRQAIQQTWHRLRASRRNRTPAEQDAMLEAARAYEMLIGIYFFANESLPSIYTCLLTLNLAERVGPSAELARAYANMTIATGSLGLHPLAAAYSRRALTTAEQKGDLNTRSYVYSITGLYRVGMGNWDEARLVLEQGVDISERLGDRRQWGNTWTLLAQLAYYEGDFVRAVEMFSELYDQAQQSGDVLQQAWALGGQGQNLLRLGQLDRACALLEQANTELAANAELPSQISNSGLLAMCRLRMGNLEGAQHAASTATRLLDSVPVPTAYYLIEGYAGVAETCLAAWEASAGSLPENRLPLARRAQWACDGLAQYARLFPIGQPRMWLCRGLYAWLAGKPAQARRAWRKGLRSAMQLEMPFEEALLSYELGRHSTGIARRSHLRRAATLFARLNAVGELARVEALG